MKKYLTNNILLKIASLIFAIMLWLIVINIDDPDTTRTINDITVTVENSDAITGINKIFRVKSGDAVSVVVTGPRSIVDKLAASDFKAVANFEDLSKTNAVPINVELKKEVYRDKVAVTIKTNTMHLEVEDIEQKEFKIEVQNTGFLEDGYIVYSNKLEQESVLVDAPTSVMNTIAGVVAKVKATGQTADFVSQVELICVDVDGKKIDNEQNNITIKTPKVSVGCVVYYSKTIKVNQNFESVLPENYQIISSKQSAETVTIVGLKEELDKIESLTVPSNLLTIEDGKKDYTIICSVTQMLPKGVSPYGKTREITFNINIDKVITKTYTIDVKKLALVNIPDDYVASIITKNSFSYIMKGLEDEINKYEIQDTYNVSLEGLDVGVHKVKVAIEDNDNCKLVSDVYIEVALDVHEEETTTEEVTTEETTEPDTTDVSALEESETTTNIIE